MISLLNESLVAKTEKKLYDYLPHEPESIAVTLFIITMAAYYIWRTFAITPVYDELYTYYNFISKGPIYAALNWTTPDDHIGYAVIAAFFNFFGNSYLGLRGLSLICAVANLVLIYKITCRYFSHGLSLGATVLYSSMDIVNLFSVQGRGYTLAVTCFLASVYLLGDICRKGEKKPRYKLLCFFMMLGVYTVPTSIFWVIPTCIAALMFLGINGVRARSTYKVKNENIYYKKFAGVFGAFITSCVMTVFLYSVVWLSLGSDILRMDEEASNFGMHRSEVLLSAPGRAFITGADRMISQN